MTALVSCPVSPADGVVQARRSLTMSASWVHAEGIRTVVEGAVRQRTDVRDEQVVPDATRAREAWPEARGLAAQGVLVLSESGAHLDVVAARRVPQAEHLKVEHGDDCDTVADRVARLAHLIPERVTGSPPGRAEVREQQ